MWINVLVLLLLEVAYFASADYGYRPSLPKLLIKPAGRSGVHNWVGYTHHYPRSIPKLPAHFKWDPYRDPLYTAFWVPKLPKTKGHGHAAHSSGRDIGHGLGHNKGHGHEIHTQNFAKIPHGFGPPKEVHHHGHSAENTIHEIHHHHTVHDNDNKFKDFDSHHNKGGSFTTLDSHQHFSSHHEVTHGNENSGGFGHPKQGSLTHGHNNIVNVVEHHDTVPSFNTHSVVIQDNNHEIISSPTIQSSPSINHFSQPTKTNTNLSGGHSSNQVSIEPGHLVGKGQFSGNHFGSSSKSVFSSSAPSSVQQSFVKTEVVPLVKPPQSDPLPLENESTISNNLGGNFDVHIKVDS